METTESSATNPGTSGQTGNSFLPWHLIPEFKPGETDINDYSRRMSFLSGIWPKEHLSLLAPRAALNCHSSAFQKVVRLDPTKLKTTTDAGVKLLVETLGGVWGQSSLEKRFERFERAIFSTIQRHDETHESYMARHEVQFEDLISQGVTLPDIRAYVLLRNSGLSADDKRRVIVDANGDLTYPKVTSALKLLGSKFFHEVQTGNKQSSRNKTYDVNFIQEDSEPDWNNGETEAFPAFHAAATEDFAFDILQNEGDEDALVISQFEDQVLETLQNDPEVSSCFNVYLEARKRLSEKIKHRGFWTPTKGFKGRGKGKGKPFAGRRTLEQRIATSRCKICNQMGHWKNECPQKDKSSSSTQVGAFAGVAEMTMSGAHPEFLDEHEPPEDAFAFAVQDSMFRSVNEIHHPDQKSQFHGDDRFWERGNKSETYSWDNTSQDLGRIANRLRLALSRKHETESQLITPRPLSPDVSLPPRNELTEELAHFVSCGASGIVDLGASLSVIGTEQFKSLCNHLPQNVIRHMKEAPCSVNFRFGNSSTVHGKRAVFIPLGHMWMKVIVAPSDTPFLIANSVFRKLGAVIDTHQNTIHFRELQCTVPISLSDRRLYMLDLVELIQNIPDRPNCGAKQADQTVCQCSPESELGIDFSRGELIKENKLKDESRDTILCTEHSLTSKHEHDPVSLPAASLSRSEDSPVTVAPCDSSFNHGLEVKSGLCHPVRKVPPTAFGSGTGDDARGDQSHDLRRSQGLQDGLWEGQKGSEVCRSGQGCDLHHMVHQQLQEQPEGHSLSSPPLHQTACGTDGEESNPQTEGQGQIRAISFNEDAIRRNPGFRSRGSGGTGSHLGTSESSRNEHHGARDHGDAGPHGPDGECFATSTSPPEPQGELSDVSLPESCEDTSILEECLKTLHAMTNHFPNVIDTDFVQEFHQHSSLEHNWVAQEMWDYLSSKPQTTKNPRTAKYHLLEVYCSQDSQLTNQAIAMGLKAKRFSLKDGDLSTQAGRFKLYDCLDQLLPLNVWCSPKCRAWCRWSTFNMYKSIQNAKKVIQAREDDRVHLLLCDALFQYQQWRNCHAHLEQPVGSQMLHQEEMQRLIQTTLRARCDMCMAGQLRHPDTGKLLQKGTQVHTTSRIMVETLDNLRCDRSHQHDQVQGQCKTSHGKRINVSEYTELYTRVFAKRLCQAILRGHQSHEPVCMLPEVACTLNTEQDDSAKRRRIGDKQPPPVAYQRESEDKSTKEAIDACLREAPRVGKRVVTSGPIVNAFQSLNPEVNIQAIELCKGADRYRFPPLGITKSGSPLRKSYGVHRNQEGYFWDPEWEDWSHQSRKNLNRKCPPARLLISVFAQRVPTATSEAPQSSAPRETEESLERFDTEQAPKRHKSHHDEFPDASLEPLPEESGPTVVGHGVKFRQLEKSTQENLMKLHKNLGHPDNRLFAKVLTEQQWSKEVIEGVSDMQCPVCFEAQRPKLARPAHLSEPREFNELIIMDGIDWTSKEGMKFHFYHIIDAGTNFQIAFVTENRTSQQVIEQLRTHWLQWAGPPKMLLTDSAGEFCSDEFSQFLQANDVKATIVPAESHWQMGRGERHGAIIQRMLDKYQVDHAISSEQDLKEALSQCTMAKNSLSRHKGYSPEILVLGKSRHTPSCNSNDPIDSSAWLYDNPDQEGTEFCQNLKRREAARQAFITADHDQKLRRAWLRRSRPARQLYVPGDWVMFWRYNKVNNQGQWNGPAKIVLTEDQNVLWLTHLSRLYRCAPEHVRPLSSREYELHQSQGTTRASLTFPSQLGTGVFQYQDQINPIVNPDNSQTTVAYQEVGVPGIVQTDSESPNADVTIGGNPPVPQPDSEPSDASLNHEPLPEEIPVPASDDEELGLAHWQYHFDQWEVRGKYLIRHHHEPRYRLFCPTDGPHIPIPLEYLEDSRMTKGQFRDNQSWEIQDLWSYTIEAHRHLPLNWTGSSWFVIKESYRSVSQQTKIPVIPDKQTKGFEMALTLTATEVEQCLQRDQYDDQIAFLASAAKRQKVEVRERDLTPGDLELFLQAKNKEVNSWLSTETVRRISRNMIPEDQILRSRWVLTWKPIDPAENTESTNKSPMKPKARLVVLGFEDPQLDSLARDSPTMGRDSRTLLLQYAASAKWMIQSFDIQTAFLRGSRTDGRILGLEPPIEMRNQMKLKPWECCELLKSAYGLVNAPLLWYEELKSSLVSLGFVISPLDPCLFVLPKRNPTDDSQQPQIHGVVGIHVDDGLAAGDDLFNHALKQLENKYPFGSKKQQSFVFTGVQIHQNADYSIDLSQEKYIEDIPPISIDRSRRMTPSEKVTEKERQDLRGLIGSVQYASTNTRPDLSARLSFIQAKITTATIAELMEANRLLHDAKLHKNVRIQIKSIPLKDLRFVSFSDASFATRANAQSQKGCLILAASSEIGQWQTSQVSPLMWYSKKISRVVGSTLASESYALSGAIDLLGWLRLHWEWLKRPSDAWRDPSKCLTQGPEAFAIVDCKSLYDLIQKTNVPQCQEYRTTLEALIIKDRVKENVSIKWVHSAAQLADSLTKIMDCTALRQFLWHGRCIIHDIDEILKQRADKRSKKQWQENLQKDEFDKEKADDYHFGM